MQISDLTAREELVAPLYHLRALVDGDLDWNYTLTASNNVITYSFDVSAGMGDEEPGYVAFNSAQQEAAITALAKASAITGITFVQGSAATADFHFATKNLPGSTAGLTSSSHAWSSRGDEIVSMEMKSYIYLDNGDSADINTNPTPGGYGYEVLLHEIGHALGLKHPFEAPYTLPTAEDTTDYTLMSYTDTEPHTDFTPYDVAALRYIYGGDGLGGLGLGPSSTGTVINGTSGNESYTGGAATDIVSALWGDDLLSGGSGADQLYGNQGTDTLYGNADNDTLFGGQGDDGVFGGSGDDALYGNMMSDIVYGGTGNDSVFGGQGDDRIYGDDGNDLLAGNLGNDTLTGGSGSDTFSFGPGGGNDVVTDFSGAAGDRISVSGLSYSVGTAADGSAVLTLSDGTTITLTGVSPSALDGTWIS